uniref:Uncharacterized protein n=1 Tax=Sphenodon punctatus TaxID=8508 RepID=A0A8D0L0Z8_SPHPU
SEASPATQGPDKQGGGDGHGATAATVEAPPLPRTPAPGDGRTPRPRGELRLTHEVLRNRSSTPDRLLGAGRGHGATPETTPRAHPEGQGHSHPPPRPRSQRQNEPRTGYGSRPSHSLYVDQPGAPRPAEPDIWLLHRGNPAQLHPGGQGPRLHLHPGPEVPQWNLYFPGTESFHCDGESKQFKACKQEPCPPEQLDPRAVQCSAFNTQEFMGRLYKWEPFTDGKGHLRRVTGCLESPMVPGL